LLLLVGTGEALVTTVADSRAIPKYVSASNGIGRVVVAVPPSTDTQQVIDRFRAVHPDSTLLARREHDAGPLFADWSVQQQLIGDLTDRQYESLAVAYENGYFERPRRTTATECADKLGISQSTFSQHVQAGLEKILDTLFGTGGASQASGYVS
jgi:predicted DNA binding protein